MRKTTSAFKLSKSVKRVMATILDPRKRGDYKRSMIEAQICIEEHSRKKVNAKEEE